MIGFMTRSGPPLPQYRPNSSQHRPRLTSSLSSFRYMMSCRSKAPRPNREPCPCCVSSSCTARSGGQQRGRRAHWSTVSESSSLFHHVKQAGRQAAGEGACLSLELLVVRVIVHSLRLVVDHSVARPRALARLLSGEHMHPMQVSAAEPRCCASVLQQHAQS